MDQALGSALGRGVSLCLRNRWGFHCARRIGGGGTLRGEDCLGSDSRWEGPFARLARPVWPPRGLPDPSLQGSRRGVISPQPARQLQLLPAGLGGLEAQPVRAFDQRSVGQAARVAVSERALEPRRPSLQCGLSLPLQFLVHPLKKFV